MVVKGGLEQRLSPCPIEELADDGFSFALAVSLGFNALESESISVVTSLGNVVWRSWTWWLGAGVCGC